MSAFLWFGVLGRAVLEAGRVLLRLVVASWHAGRNERLDRGARCP